MYVSCNVENILCKFPENFQIMYILLSESLCNLTISTIEDGAMAVQCYFQQYCNYMCIICMYVRKTEETSYILVVETATSQNKNRKINLLNSFQIVLYSKIKNRISDVMVNVLALGALDRVFEL